MPWLPSVLFSIAGSGRSRRTSTPSDGWIAAWVPGSRAACEVLYLCSSPARRRPQGLTLRVGGGCAGIPATRRSRHAAALPVGPDDTARGDGSTHGEGCQGGLGG